MLVLYSALVKVIMAKLRLNTTDNSFVKPTSGVQHAVTVAKLAVDRPQTAYIPPNHRLVLCNNNLFSSLPTCEVQRMVWVWGFGIVKRHVRAAFSQEKNVKSN